MEPIQQILNRIRWDDEFGRGNFQIGIYDRFKDNIELLNLDQLEIEKGNPFSFTVWQHGREIVIPFHRVREVYKDGTLIWRRA